MDMMMKLNDDVEFALGEYNEAIEQENQAKRVWDRRKLLETYPPAAPSADEQLLLNEEGFQNDAISSYN